MEELGCVWGVRRVEGCGLEEGGSVVLNEDDSWGRVKEDTGEG